MILSCEKKGDQMQELSTLLENGTQSELISLCENLKDDMHIWDFDIALGNSIKEKYEHLILFVHQVTQKLIRQGASGYFYIITSPEISSIFETIPSDFCPISSKVFEESYKKLERLEGFSYRGIVQNTWALYQNSGISKNNLIIGTGRLDGDIKNFSRVVVANFVI